jgi:hypothetical protein
VSFCALKVMITLVIPQGISSFEGQIFQLFVCVCSCTLSSSADQINSVPQSEMATLFAPGMDGKDKFRMWEK